MIESYATLPINHVLRSESWACKWLQSYEGKTVCLCIPPFVNIKLIVLANGEFGISSGSHEADTTLTILPVNVPGLMAHDESAYDEIKITGDTLFAEDLITICKNLKLNLEQELGKYIGDIPAHRIAKTGEGFLQWQANLFKNLSDSIGEYLAEEKPLVTKNSASRHFSQQIEVLQNDLDQLEIRINRLIQKSETR